MKGLSKFENSLVYTKIYKNMKLLLSILLLFSISSTSFAQKARVLLAYNAFNFDKDTLQIGNTLSYSENQNEFIFLKEKAYLALINENGSILEWKNKEKGNYKIEFDESDTTFNAARKQLEYLFFEKHKNYSKNDNPYLSLSKTGAVSRPPPPVINVLADSKSNYLRDSLQIFISYFDDYFREEEEIKFNSLEIKIKDLRNNLILSNRLDTTFFLVDGNKILEDNFSVLYNFSIQTTQNREFHSPNYVLKKPHKEISYQENYFQSKEQTAIGVFLQFLYSCEEYELNIYSYQLYHEFLKELSKEAHSTVPTWKEFKENYRIGYY